MLFCNIYFEISKSQKSVDTEKAGIETGRQKYKAVADIPID